MRENVFHHKHYLDYDKQLKQSALQQEVTINYCNYSCKLLHLNVSKSPGCACVQIYNDYEQIFSTIVLTLFSLFERAVRYMLVLYFLSLCWLSLCKTFFICFFIVCNPPRAFRLGGGRGWTSNQIFKKGGGPQLSEGDWWERGGAFFWGVAIFA